MRTSPPYPQPARRADRGSVLVIVLWIALGLVTLTLYFANAMGFELRASDNRVSALTADQAIEGATRYVSYVLSTLGTNGIVPDYAAYYREAVPVGDAHFWLIGRSYDNQTPSAQPFFGLIDEASKLNLNTANTNMLALLPRMTTDLATYIVQWRSTNGDGSQTYAMLHPPYQCKSTNFETTDELRLVYGMTMDILVGEDVTRNGVLDPGENDDSRNNLVDSGVLEYVTVYSREPNTKCTNVNNRAQITALLRDRLGATRANEVIRRLGPATTTFRSPLQFYRSSGLKIDEFTQIGTNISVTSSLFKQGRVNINTASPVVLACLPGLTDDLAAQLVSYRQLNPDKIATIAWVVEALGQNNNTALQTLAGGDYITTQSYQFTADIAAIGPFGRGYRRVRFVFDTSEGTPKIIYRQDLSHLGWALGKDARQTWLIAKGTHE
ncbi:MAG: helix-hairpin-helix domain-containing protein [Verrucomicrobiota bacterium]